MEDQIKPSNCSKTVRDFNEFLGLLGCHLTSFATCVSTTLLRHRRRARYFYTFSRNCKVFIMWNTIAVYPVISIFSFTRRRTEHTLSAFLFLENSCSGQWQRPLKTTMSSESPSDPSIPTITVSKDVWRTQSLIDFNMQGHSWMKTKRSGSTNTLYIMEAEILLIF